jgi:hypothetical protein
MVKQLLARQVANVQPDEAAVEELYQQMALEVKIRANIIGPASHNDTLSLYKKLLLTI